MGHIALKVSDLARAKIFYQDALGMKVVWERDDRNVYRSSGCDKLALPEVADGTPNLLRIDGSTLLASSSRVWSECASWSVNSSVGVSRSSTGAKSLAMAAQLFMAPIRTV